MKVNITSKNLNVGERMKDHIEEKFSKLDKYFSTDIDANIMLSQEKNRQKIEATIYADGTIFRAEETSDDIYESVDLIIDKLSTQMSRFKSKLVRKNRGKGVKYEAIPEIEQEEEIKVVKTKKFELEPMDVDGAIVQMELLQHTFYVFLNVETDSVNVVYKRRDGNYGVLETTY